MLSVQTYAPHPPPSPTHPHTPPPPPPHTHICVQLAALPGGDKGRSGGQSGSGRCGGCVPGQAGRVNSGGNGRAPFPQPTHAPTGTQLMQEIPSARPNCTTAHSPKNQLHCSRAGWPRQRRPRRWRRLQSPLHPAALECPHWHPTETRGSPCEGQTALPKTNCKIKMLCAARLFMQQQF